MLDKLKLKFIRKALRRYHEKITKHIVKTPYGFNVIIRKGTFSPKYTFSTFSLMNYLNQLFNSLQLIPLGKVSDVGTGSGVLAIFLAKKHRNCNIVATDISFNALLNAKENIYYNFVDDKIDLVCCSTLTPFRSNSFNLIISNPPYLPIPPKDFLDFMICAGKRMDVVKELIREAYRVLKEKGKLIFTLSSLSQIDETLTYLTKFNFVYVRREISRTPLDKIFVIDSQLIYKDK